MVVHYALEWEGRQGASDVKRTNNQSSMVLGLHHGCFGCSYMISGYLSECLTLCDPMDCSTPDFPVPHHLSEPAQTHALVIVLAVTQKHSHLVLLLHSLILCQDLVWAILLDLGCVVSPLNTYFLAMGFFCKDTIVREEACLALFGIKNEAELE